MPWKNDPESRRQSSERYGAAWRKARQGALKRAGGKCEQCGSADRVQVDHIDGVANDPQHTRLRVLCTPCHRRVTAQQGGGYRRGNRGPASDPDVEVRTRW